MAKTRGFSEDLMTMNTCLVALRRVAQHFLHDSASQQELDTALYNARAAGCDATLVHDASKAALERASARKRKAEEDAMITIITSI
jgi:hypothetical protein